MSSRTTLLAAPPRGPSLTWLTTRAAKSVITLSSTATALSRRWCRWTVPPTTLGVSAHPDKPWLIGLNRCSIGIAFDNPGKLDQDGRAWFGHQYEAAVYAERDDQYGKWLPYTTAQLDAFEDIVTALDRGYGIDGVYSHYQVATPRGRKADTNPTLDGFLRAMHHSVEDKAADMPLSERAVVNAAGGLNLRGEPGRHGPIIEDYADLDRRERRTASAG